MLTTYKEEEEEEEKDLWKIELMFNDIVTY